jgi:hypothetical protein
MNVFGRRLQRVRFRESIASADWGYRAGEIADLETDVAEAWCRSGVCEPAPDAELAAPPMAQAPRCLVETCIQPSLNDEIAVCAAHLRDLRGPR